MGVSHAGDGRRSGPVGLYEQYESHVMNTDRGSGRLIELTRCFVQRKLVPWPEFRAAFIVGSVAHREARPDSDVDCLFVFDRLDERIVPAEFVWCPDTDAIYTIFEV